MPNHAIICKMHNDLLVYDGKKLEIFNSKMAYEIKEILDEIEEERFIEEKIKQYSVKE